MQWLHSLQDSPQRPTTPLCIRSVTLCIWPMIFVSGLWLFPPLACDFLHLVHDSGSDSLFSTCVWLWISPWLSQLVNGYLWSVVLYSWPMTPYIWFMTLYICSLTCCLFSVTPCIQFLIIIAYQPFGEFAGLRRQPVLYFLSTGSGLRMAGTSTLGFSVNDLSLPEHSSVSAFSGENKTQTRKRPIVFVLSFLQY